MKETGRIGNDLEVRRLGFGAMRLCGPGILGWPEPHEHALRILRRAVELGVQLIDTALAYGPEVNELQIAAALHPYPEGLVVATKGGSLRGRSGEWLDDGRPEAIRAHCEGSLQRLRLDRIDLYQLHAPDRKVPLEESLGALAQLREEGKIRHVGLSNVTVTELERARHIVPIASVQNRFSLAERGSENVLERCDQLEIAFLPYFPLEAGRLPREDGALDEVARRHGATTAQVALAWLLQRSPVVCPIPGTSSLEHLEENMAAASLSLSSEDMAELG